MDKFRKLGIIEPILKSIEDEKFENPTDVQEKAIPLVLQGKDVIAGSATGSGKTLAFGSGIIQNCERGKGIQALILTPTRELAEQVATDMKTYSKYKPLKVLSIYGGVSINPQIKDLMTADVVVGTPGRILDHMQRRTIDLSKVKLLVLDEADRMLDMGFIDDVRNITKRCPNGRQTLLFSATITQDIKDIAHNYMVDPIKVSVECYVDPSKLTQTYYDVNDGLKFSLLVHLLKHEQTNLVMVFCNSRHTTDFVANNLKFSGIDAFAIHGGFTQDKRSRVMENFNSQSAKVLVCTDVAARGLHIEGVSHVYNYDIPKESKQYIHRIGRTARAGKEGKAVNILSSRDHDNFARVLRDNDVKITKEEKPYIQKINVRNVQTDHGFGPRRSGFNRGPRSGFGNRNGPRRHSGPRGRSGFGNRSDGPRRHSGQGQSGQGRSGFGNRNGPRRDSGNENSGFGNRNGPRGHSGQRRSGNYRKGPRAY
jgi:ATP-dependent RNA helicase DeaD